MQTMSKRDVETIRKSELFDPVWYVEAYPDVAKLGMDPAEHFLKYGFLLRRDPGPQFSTSFYLNAYPGTASKKVNPILHLARSRKPDEVEPQRKSILWAACNVAQRGQHRRAIELAETNLPTELAYTVEILRANAALARGSEERWLAHLNAYIGHFGIAPVRLNGSGPMLSRLTTDALAQVETGPLVSVIMPAWNADDTVEAAARSILNQTWRPLELLIVDDASDDGTWSVLQRLAATDSRVKLLRNKVNVGPYVSKNIALMGAKGDYVTGHDADDWAHPQRLENHLREVLASNGAIRASLTYMVRMQPGGHFGHVGKCTTFSFDGVARKASISCIFERPLLREVLGFWDSVRFAADSEMIARTEAVAGRNFRILQQIGMLCLDVESSLTNHPDHGVDKVNGLLPVRAQYRESWIAWHRANLPNAPAFLDFPLSERRYGAGEAMVVPANDVWQNLQSMRHELETLPEAEMLQCA